MRGGAPALGRGCAGRALCCSLCRAPGPERGCIQYITLKGAVRHTQPRRRTPAPQRRPPCCVHVRQRRSRCCLSALGATPGRLRPRAARSARARAALTGTCARRRAGRVARLAARPLLVPLELSAAAALAARRLPGPRAASETLIERV